MIMLSVVILSLALQTKTVEGKWYLYSREGECIALELLAKREKLDKVPKTPEEYAEMMRKRGYEVTLGLPEGFPKEEFEGRMVMVSVRDDKTPIFVREELCQEKIEERSERPKKKGSSNK